MRRRRCPLEGEKSPSLARERGVKSMSFSRWEENARRMVAGFIFRGSLFCRCLERKMPSNARCHAPVEDDERGRRIEKGEVKRAEA